MGKRKVKNMKKWISLILVLAALVICFASCGDKEPEEKHFKDPSEQETVTRAVDTELTAETAGDIDMETPRIPVN